MFAQTKKWIGYVLAWLVLMVIPLVVLFFRDTAGGFSETNQFTITSFRADYRATPVDGSLQIAVTETITAEFPPYRNRGIERRLDNRYGNTSLEISDIEVTDRNGDRLQSRTMRADDGDTILRIGDPDRYVEGSQTYVIRYLIGNGMVAAPDGRQEIYLDTNGTGWAVPIEQLRVTMAIDPSLVGALDGQQACYVGTAGSTSRCELSRDETRFTTTAVDLAARENVTIAVGFAPDTVARTLPAVRQGALVPPALAIALLPLIGLVFLVPVLITRHVQRRTAHANRAVVTQFTPPDHVEPMLAADLLGRPEKGAAAQLTRLVVSGMAVLHTDGPAGESTISSKPRSRLSRADTADVRGATTVTLTPAIETLPDSGMRAICKLLFNTGRAKDYRPVRLGEISEYRVEMATAKRLDAIIGAGLRNPAAGAGAVLGLGLTAMIVAGWFTIFNGFGNVWAFLAAGLVGMLLVVAAVYWFPKVGRLTPEGRQVREHLLGLQDFVTLAEADRIAWLQNAVDAPRIAGADRATLIKLYEPLLPYAIVFGVEQTWAQVLGELYQRMPTTAAAEPTQVSLADVVAVSWWASSANDYQHHWYRDHQSTYNFWDSRGDFGEGVGAAIGEAVDSWATSRDDDSGGSGGWFSGGGGGGSSFSGFSSGSSGGGFSGGGAGGGGGGGW